MHWANIGDDKRAGFCFLPSYSDKHTDWAKRVNMLRERCYNLLSTEDAPRDTTKRFITYHHFPLSFLHSEKNGPLPCIEKHVIVEERVNLEKDVILFGSEKGKLYAAPCHPWHDVCDNVVHRQTPNDRQDSALLC